LTYRVGFSSHALLLRELFSDMTLRTIRLRRSNLSHKRISYSPSVVPGRDKYTILSQIQQYILTPSETDEKESHLLVDLEALSLIPKECPPEHEQLITESRMVWKDVTELIHTKEYARATKVKQRIEAKQRTDAALRQERNEEWVPKYFVKEDIGGRAELTREGREMLETVYAAEY
jgi:hypothetical protein